MSARAEMSAVRTRRRVMARRVRVDDRAGALWHRHCSLVGSQPTDDQRPHMAGLLLS